MLPIHYIESAVLSNRAFYNVGLTQPPENGHSAGKPVHWSFVLSA